MAFAIKVGLVAWVFVWLETGASVRTCGVKSVVARALLSIHLTLRDCWMSISRLFCSQFSRMMRLKT